MMYAFDPIVYTGLTDTATGFSGNTSLQDVRPGSQLTLDTAENQDLSTYDLWTDPNPSADLALSGTSDPAFASAAIATPYPNAQPPNSNSWAGLSALAKFGSAFSALIGGSTATVQGAAASGNTPTTVAPLYHPNGTTLAILVIVTVAAILLLRGD